MRVPLEECHLTLYDTVGCIVNPLPLEDLLIVGHSDKNANAIMQEKILFRNNNIFFRNNPKSRNLT
jgi:hypothetical protein